MIYKVVTTILIFISNGFCNDNNILKIGAIFDTDNQLNEKAFDLAIAEINTWHWRENLSLERVVRKISTDDPSSAMEAACSLISEGVVGILSPLLDYNYKMTQSICDDKDIPLLAVRWDNEPIDSVTNFYPYQEVLNRAYISILDEWNYKDFVILYENNDSLRKIEAVIEYYYSIDKKVVAQELNPVGDYRQDLKKLAKSGVTRFVIDCSRSVLEEVLRQAQQVSLMSDRYHYFITNLDFHTLNLNQYQYSGTNITGVRLVDPNTDLIQNFAHKLLESEIPDLNPFAAAWSLQMETLLVKDAIMMLGEALVNAPKNVATQSMNCDSDSRWIFGSTITNSLQNMRYPGVTRTVKFDLKGHRSDFNLDVIELTEGGIIKVANWTTLDGLKVTRIYPDNSEIKHLSDWNFRVLISRIEPFAMYKSTVNTLSGNARYEGYAIDLIQELSAMEGFNYTFIDQVDKVNGGYDEKLQNWTGMIGRIHFNEADLALGDLTITSERQEAVDFATPYMTLGISILYHKPTKAPPSFFSFADPFALEVWKLIGAAYFGVSIVLYILGRICASEWSNPYPCIEEPEYLVNQLSLRNCFWFTTASLMQQGSDIGPIAVSTRMVAGVWWFFTLIMVSSYTANLAAFLTTETPQPHFNDVFELVKNADKFGIKYGAKREGSTKNFFRDSQMEVYKKIFDYMEENADDVLFDNPTDGVYRAEESNYAFFMESISIDYEIQRRCNLTQVGDLLDEKSYGIAMRKNSTYRNVFNTAVSTLQHTGKLAELKRKWWEEKRGGGLCSGTDDSGEATALDLKNVEGVFWVTLGGTLLACIFVFIELTLHVVKVSVKRKTSLREALKEEFKFYFKFSGMVKPVIMNTEHKKTESEDLQEL